MYLTEKLISDIAVRPELLLPQEFLAELDMFLLLS